MLKLKPVICCVILIAVAHASHAAMASAIAVMPDCRPALLPKVADIRRYSLGNERVCADFYWLLFMQYVGDIKAREIDQSRDSEKYLDLIIGLDPHFIKAYFFALFLIGGDLHQPRNATALIDKGISENPESWYLLYLAGLNQYLYAHNELMAATYYHRAAKFPLSPKWLEHLAGILGSKAPPVVKQINVWENVYETSTDDGIKARAQRELIELWLGVYNSSKFDLKGRARKQLDRLGAEVERK